MRDLKTCPAEHNLLTNQPEQKNKCNMPRPAGVWVGVHQTQLARLNITTHRGIRAKGVGPGWDWAAGMQVWAQAGAGQ